MDDARTPADPAALHALANDVRVTAGRLKRKMREHGGFSDLTAAQTAVLSRLERDGPATGSALARAEGMRPQSMGAIVAALEAAGLILGRPDPGDGRQTILDLTPACRDRITEARAAREDWLQRAIQAQLTPDECRQLAVGLALLDRIVSA